MLFSLDNLQDYKTLANAILAHQGNLVLLTGPLGVGKTMLTQYLAKALGSQANVTSPTYTLIHEYPTAKGILVHIDAYRLPSTEALFELGLEDYLERAILVIVEWGEGLLTSFPTAILVKLEFVNESRIATIIKH